MYGCSFQIINTDLPKYLNDVLHVSISDNGLYSAIPRVLSVFVSIGSGVVADVLQNRLNIDRTNVRKLFVISSKQTAVFNAKNYGSWTLIMCPMWLYNFAASVIPATFLMLASYAGCDEPLAVTFLIIAISGHGLNAAGGAINLFDLTPNYAAQLDAIINTAATVFGMCLICPRHFLCAGQFHGTSRHLMCNNCVWRVVLQAFWLRTPLDYLRRT